nr:MAG TPA: hypothetical protein [Caudoviricetes sp.]
MADISKEINDFRKAVKGKDVRGSMISLAEKVNEEVETNTAHVDEAVDTANGASQTANQTSKDAQKAITEANITLQAANAAKESAQESSMAASVSAAAAADSEGAAGESAASAAASAKAAEDIAAGLGGFDGTATSVKATDTQGLVVAAGADSNAQALLDALAHKVALELVSNTALTTKLADYVAKTDIVQVESTATNKVPSSAYLKQVKDSIDSNLSNANADINPLKSNYVDNMDNNIVNKVNIVLWNSDTASTPFKTGNTIYGNGFCITYSSGDQWLCQLAMAVGDPNLFTRYRREGVWSGWTTK